MTTLAVLTEVEQFLSDNRKRAYQTLLEQVMEDCKTVKEQLGDNVVSRVYGRSDKQSGENFKSILKIADKVSLKRSEHGAFQVREVRDTVGLTVVVQYPDQIAKFIERLKPLLLARHVKDEKVERVEKFGYFATHVDLSSTSALHAGLWCELQVKTMLHDAWSAKMHDLNYKPSGQIDSRLDQLMRVNANSLQAIELQSETLRDLITERWRIEDAWRQAARRKMFETVPAWKADSAPTDEVATDLRIEMGAASETIRDADSGSEYLTHFVERIARIKARSLREGWMLAAYLGSLRHGDETHVQFALVSIEDWVAEGLKAFASDDCNLLEYELWSAPLACYSIGAMSKAISVSRELLAGWPLISARNKSVLKANLANFLIENEYFMPSRGSTKRLAAKAEIDGLLADCALLEDEDPSPFYDLRGMFLVAFAEKAKEVETGISLIEKGRISAASRDLEFAEACYQLHARLAWRRLLELENAS